MALVSIIVPVYKVEKYIYQCVESLRNQTLQDIEIILVDDGSPDQCGKICDQLATLDKRIKVIHQENQGLSCARNIGFRNACSDYICFIDSDDYVAEQYCQILYELIKDTDKDYSVCGVCRFKNETVPKTKHSALVGEFTNIEFLEKQLKRQSEFGVWNKMYRKESIETLQFMPGKIHEDVIWSADIARTCKNGVICTGQELYYYRQNENGIVSQGAQKCNPDRIFAGEYLASVIKEIKPSIYSEALKYAIEYPWMFIDSIYVHRQFSENINFLDEMQRYLRKYIKEYEVKKIFSSILLKRMRLYSKSRKLYHCNVYLRLARLYVYRILHLDAYKTGHGI